MQIIKRLINIYSNFGFLKATYKLFLYLFKFFYYYFWRISPFKFSLSLYGVLIKRDFNGPNSVTFKYSLIGQYGKFFSNFLKKQEDASIFLDIGANLGIYTLVALKNSNIEKIYSFEPQSVPFKFLNENVNRNNGHNKCTTLKYGVSHKTKKSFLKIDNNHLGKSKLKVSSDGKTMDKSQFSKDTIFEDIYIIGNKELSDLLSLDLSKKIGVKIDTEGHELFVLEGLKGTNFWKNISWIFMEFSRKANHKKCLNIMSNEGFKIIKKVGNEEHYDLLFKK
tara:strand:- start:197 stop:1033 length:837 start_codon:yes stop_codon:yes gene_type:complete